MAINLTESGASGKSENRSLSPCLIFQLYNPVRTAFLKLVQIHLLLNFLSILYQVVSFSNSIIKLGVKTSEEESKLVNKLKELLGSL